MTSRRSFLKTAGAMTAGVAAGSSASSASAAGKKDARAKKYQGPHEMPTRVTFCPCRTPTERRHWG
jgi:anaerobic selenocysteine-containing dehydrogenase